MTNWKDLTNSKKGSNNTLALKGAKSNTSQTFLDQFSLIFTLSFILIAYRHYLTFTFFLFILST